MNHKIIIALVLTLIASEVLSQCAHANDLHALNAIFAEPHLDQNAFAVHQRAAELPAEERYEFLSEWVLPNSDHDTIRMGLGFTPLHPAPPVQGLAPDDFERLRVAEQMGQSRIQTGGRMVAPAVDLVTAAQTLGRLDDVRNRIESFAATSDHQLRSRLAMLIVLETAQEEFEAAIDHLQQLFELVKSGTHTSFFERCPETIAISAGLNHPETREVAREMLFQIVQSQLRHNLFSGERSWEIHMEAMWGRANAADHKLFDEVRLTTGKPPALQQWSGTNRVLWVTRGSGRPQALWQIDGWRVDNLAVHCDDYLFFQSPLRGNYEVECDITLFDYRDSTIYVAGKWVDLGFGLTTYKLGNVRGAGTRRLSRKMAEPRGWFRYRAVARDNILSVYLNGYQIHQEALPEEHDPWLAIRSVLRNTGMTRGLRITGNPVIPESINLSAAPDLPGWMPYFSEAVRQNGSWRHTVDESDNSGIQGVAQPKYFGTVKESLLYYVRPMLEDGVIEYEFFYREGEKEAHPALDRLAFMLGRDGVRIHWITDGEQDRTSLDPTNLDVEPDNRRGPAELPLKNNNWNHLRLSLIDDTIHLILNGQEIYERELEVTNQRTFGLFHFADRTELRVRNIVWTGDWPRMLPAVKQQELAGNSADFLDTDLPKLTAVFEHDFAEGGLPGDRFAVYQQDMQNGVVAQPDGVQMTRPGQTGRYLHHHIWPRLSIKGDFDVTASFKEFKSMPEEGSKDTRCTLRLETRMDDESQTIAYLLRRHNRIQNKDDDRMVQGSFSRIENGEDRYHFFGETTFEAESGTLRLARRGQKLYFLIAEYDSSYFRLIGEQTLSDADVTPDGLRLTAVTYGPGSMSVVWRKLEIRAEEIVDRSIAAERRIPDWGLMTESAARSTVLIGGDTLTITAPDIYVDNYPPGEVNAPRVLEEVSGDFTAEVDITHLDEAAADSVHKSLGDFQTAYHAGTLLLRSDDSTFVRLERVSTNTTGQAAYSCSLQIWKDKNLQFNRSRAIENKPIRLRLKRTGKKLTASFSRDEGETWTEFPEQPLEGFSEQVNVGVSLTSNTEKGCKVQFKGFKLEASDN